MLSEEEANRLFGSCAREFTNYFISTVHILFPSAVRNEMITRSLFMKSRGMSWSGLEYMHRRGALVSRSMFAREKARRCIEVAAATRYVEF